MMNRTRFFTFFFIYIIFISVNAQNYDSLKHQLQIAENDTAFIQTSIELADFYYYDNPDSAVIYYNKGIALSKTLKLYQSAFGAQTNLFFLYLDQSDFMKAKSVAIDALELSKISGDSLLISQAHSNMGNLYMFLELNEKALDHFHQAIQVYPIEKNPLEAGKLFGRLGNLYLFMDYLDDAEQSYIKANDFFQKVNFQKGIILVTQNLGVIEKQRKNYDKAIELYNLAQKNHASIENPIGVAQCMANIGNIYIEKKEYSKALINLQKALKIFVAQNQKIDEILCRSQMANIYVKTNQPEQAIKNITMSHQLVQMLPENSGTRLAILFRMQEIYAEIGDSAIAYKFLKEYQVLNDTILIQDSQRRIEILKTQFEFEQKEKDIQILQVENKLKETEINRKNVLQIYYLLVIGLSLFALSIVVFFFRLKKKANVALTLKNAEVLQQKEEIQAQSDEIEAQRDLVFEQKQVLESTNLQISQSIEYASIIQNSILPDPYILQENISDYFIFFKPKDVVSGDFYWWANVDQKTVITAADCTGHGVPGAFMSMLGISFLQEIVVKENITEPGIILQKLREDVIRSLKQNAELDSPRDGMEMAIISIDHKTNVLEYAGAHNPIYIIREHKPKIADNRMKEYSMEGNHLKLYEIAPDKMPISVYIKMSPFSNQIIPIEKGDKIYLFSDGFADQFGGEHKKKFLSASFKELLLKNAGEAMAVQKEKLESAFESWKGNHEQIDDIVVLGIQI